MQKILIFIMASLWLSSCSVMDEQDCKLANWQNLGFSDGVNGRSDQFFVSRSEACAKHGINSDNRSYFAAKKEGLKIFCTTANGFKLGEQGSSYNHVCAENNEAKFLQAYDLGKIRFQQKEKVRTLQEQINNLDNDIKSYRFDINKVENSLVKSGVSQDQRYQFLNRIRELRSDINRIQIERLFLVSQLHNERQILARMPNSVNF